MHLYKFSTRDIRVAVILNIAGIGFGLWPSFAKSADQHNKYSLIQDPIGLARPGIHITPKPDRNVPDSGEPSAKEFVTRGDPNSMWYLAQWGNPHPLDFNSTPQASCFGNDPKEIWATGSSRVCILGANSPFRIELAQNGQDLNCAHANESDSSIEKEFDLFVQPRPWNPVGFRPSPTLNHLHSVNLSFGLEIPYRKIQRKCSMAGNNYYDSESVVAAVVLHNSSSNQTLFYQIQMQSANANSDSICGQNGSWFYSPNPNNPSVFGVNDSPTVFSTWCKLPGTGRSYYDFNILNRLKDLISNGPNSIDRDIGHWFVSSFYLGGIGYGNFILTTTWDQIGLIVDADVPPSPFPNQSSNFDSGLFSVGPDIYYANESNQYCHFPTWNYFLALSGENDTSRVKPLKEIPKRLTGGLACIPLNQIFMVGPKIFYANDRRQYCHYKDWNSFVSLTGIHSTESLIKLDRKPPQSEFAGPCLGY